MSRLSRSGSALLDLAFLFSDIERLSARFELGFLFELRLDLLPFRDLDLSERPLSFKSCKSVGISLEFYLVFLGTLGVSYTIAISSLGVCRHDTNLVFC